MKTAFALILAAGMAAPAFADPIVHTYEDLTEGFYGTLFSHNGVTYREVNTQSGVFPDGSTFTPGDLGNQVVIENAGLLYNDFPEWGSPTNAMTFGSVYVPGENLSIGALSTVTMDLDTPATSASLELAFYENGPWGGIVYRLDAMLNGQIVASDSYVLAGDDDGRDNIAFRTFSVGGVVFDSLHLYATFGDSFSAPRGLLDNLTITPVPAPGGIVVMAGLAGFVGRRRR